MRPARSAWEMGVVVRILSSLLRPVCPKLGQTHRPIGSSQNAVDQVIGKCLDV